MTSVYKAQCKTWLIAQKLACNFSNVSSINAVLEPPHCLRVVKAYRTAAIQQFRDDVAKTIKLKVH